VLLSRACAARHVSVVGCDETICFIVQLLMTKNCTAMEGFIRKLTKHDFLHLQRSSHCICDADRLSFFGTVR
jgi:hypothetical protein